MIRYTLIITLIFNFVALNAQLTNAKEIDQFIQSEINNKKIAGAVVLVANKNDILYHKAFGKQSIEDNIKMKTSSIFRIYSMTKSVTSIAALMLIDQGKVRLEDPIDKYFPELKDLKVLDKGKRVGLKRTATVKDLLRHTAGFAYGFFLGKHRVDFMYNKDHPLISTTSEQFVQKLSQYPLRNQPGEKYVYSLGVDLLGVLVERVSGQRLGAFMKANIFDPLGMTDTHFQLPKSKEPRFCSNYNGRLKLKESYKNSLYLMDKFHMGGGGLVSTSTDYMKFCRLLLNNTIIGKDTLVNPSLFKEATSNQLPEGEAVYKHMGKVGVGFGYGFSTYEQEWGQHGHKGDFGWSGAANTHYMVSPKTGLAIIVMSQRMPAYQEIGQKVKRIVYRGVE